jgi:hypothetical protein
MSHRKITILLWFLFHLEETYVLRSVAFEKADIKEHVVSLHFQEWNQVEEGQLLPRVWIRIYRIPQKLREFSVFWALGSMLGATMTVDMVSSLWNEYGRVQIAVLDASILPNRIDSGYWG